MTEVTRGDGTEGEEGKGEEGGEEILAHGRAGQSKVVQEVLADLKIHFFVTTWCPLGNPPVTPGDQLVTT